MGKQTISARIDSVLADNFRFEAESQGVSQRVLLERAIRMYLKSCVATEGDRAEGELDAQEWRQWRSTVEERLNVLGNVAMRLDKAISGKKSGL